MADGMRRDDYLQLMGKNSLILGLGVLALGFYWAWIFSCFSSAVMNPFGAREIVSYQLFLVMAAGVSALSMVATSVLPSSVEVFFRSSLGSVLTAVLAMLAGIPSLMSQLGIDLDYALSVGLWCVGMCASTFVYLKTAPFLVWLKRPKLSRCIGLSFLAAAVGYVLAQVLVPVAGVAAVMLYPVASVACSQGCEVYMASAGVEDEPKLVDREQTILSRLAELVNYAPTTLIYSISFGFVSAVVLMLAVREGFIPVVAASILFSAVFTVVYTFTVKAQFDSVRFRRFLLPLIAIALLPFPYLPDPLKIAFLSFAVFGFTCFDAIGWGDLADEVRDRNLQMFRYMSAAQMIGFAGIFVGWLAGWWVCSNFGTDLDTPFGIVSAVLVILLILEVVLGDRLDPAGAAPSSGSEYVDTWEDGCREVAASYGLTGQETNIFIMLARGRNLKYVADALCISGHTVKTHIYHIYRKLDIHSQQELINLVEQRGNSKKNTSSEG